MLASAGSWSARLRIALAWRGTSESPTCMVEMLFGCLNDIFLPKQVQAHGKNLQPSSYQPYQQGKK